MPLIPSVHSAPSPRSSRHCQRPRASHRSLRGMGANPAPLPLPGGPACSLHLWPREALCAMWGGAHAPPPQAALSGPRSPQGRGSQGPEWQGGGVSVPVATEHSRRPLERPGFRGPHPRPAGATTPRDGAGGHDRHVGRRVGPGQRLWATSPWEGAGAWEWRRPRGACGCLLAATTPSQKTNQKM